MGNTFGKLFSITTWGESHGPALGVVIDGCPPGLPLQVIDIQSALDRRRPGQSTITSPRAEADQVEILSGVFEGRTLGTPIGLLIRNRDARPADYEALQQVFRPGHADFTYAAKYGANLPSGGGRASARETVARVAAGAIAAKCLKLGAGVDVIAYVEAVHTLEMERLEGFLPTREAIEATPIRCPDILMAGKMIAAIEAAKAQGDSVGGVIFCDIRGLPIGLGAPVFDRLEADLAKAMLSIPSTKGFEVGEGFSAARRLGSENNDVFENLGEAISFKTNHAGGVLGGLSTGAPVQFRVAFKPPSTIAKTQLTVDRSGVPVTFSGTGRLDPCVLPRAVPIVEAMAALVVIDHYMLHTAHIKAFDF